MSAPVSARTSWAERRPQPGIDSACCSCSSYGASSRSITAVSSLDLGVDLVDAGEHGLEQGGVLGGEEFRAVQGLLQVADLAAGPARASWASTLGLRSPAIRWSMMSRPVTPCRSVTTLDSLIAGRFQQLLGPVLLPGPVLGQVTPVAGVQPDDPELRSGDEAGPDRAALEALRQPAGVRRVPLGAAGQVLDLLGVRQHALEPLGLEPVERALPVVRRLPPSPPPAPARTAASPPAPAPPAGWWRSCGSRSSAAPGPYPRAPGSSRTARPCRCRCRTPGPGTAARRSPLPRPASLPGQPLHALACEEVPPGEPGGEAEESSPRARSDNERPLRVGSRRQADPRPHRAKEETTSRAVPPPIFTPVRRRAQRYQG